MDLRGSLEALSSLQSFGQQGQGGGLTLADVMRMASESAGQRNQQGELGLRQQQESRLAGIQQGELGVARGRLDVDRMAEDRMRTRSEAEIGQLGKTRSYDIDELSKIADIMDPNGELGPGERLMNAVEALKVVRGMLGGGIASSGPPPPPPVSTDYTTPAYQRIMEGESMPLSGGGVRGAERAQQSMAMPLWKRAALEPLNPLIGTVRAVNKGTKSIGKRVGRFLNRPTY